MQNGITGIDHPVIAVRDMEGARKTFERLGFTVPPRGSHIEWGTGNWAIMFKDDYLELRGIIDPARPTHGTGKFLEKREGLMGVALGTIGAAKSHDLLVQSGFHPKPVTMLTRNFELPEGWAKPRFALCFLDEKDVPPGLMSVVFCEHLTPELIRKPEFLRHANGAQRVHSMTGVVPDLAAAAAANRRLFGEAAVREEKGQVIIDAGRVATIRLVRPGDLETVHGGVAFDKPVEPPYLAAVTIGVDKISSAAKVLDKAGIRDVRPNKTTIRVAPKDACGAIIEFVEG